MNNNIKYDRSSRKGTQEYFLFFFISLLEICFYFYLRHSILFNSVAW